MLAIEEEEKEKAELAAADPDEVQEIKIYDDEMAPLQGPINSNSIVNSVKSSGNLL